MSDAAAADRAFIDSLTGKASTDQLQKSIDRLNQEFFDGLIGPKTYDEAIARLTGRAKDVDVLSDKVEQFGLLFTSSLGQLLDVGSDPVNIFKALAQDVAKLIIQLEILEPLMQSIRDFSKQSKSGGGSFLGLLIDGFGKFLTGGGGAGVASGAGAANGQWDILPPAVAGTARGGASYTFNYNIGATYGDAALNKALLDNQRATIAQLQDMQARGRG
jgi:hypothetical protein